MDYKKIYYQIINRAKTRKLDGYSEKHHIIPRCMMGNNNPSNLVSLTAREHFLCHMLLCEIYPTNNKLRHALFLMAIGKQKVIEKKYVIGSRVYERLRVEYSKMMTGKKQSKETKDKKSKKMIEVWANKSQEEKDERARKFVATRKAKGNFKKTKEQKDKISKILIGRKMPWRTKPIIQYTMDGEFVREWNSNTEIIKSKKYGDVSAVCNNKQKSAYGFLWKHK
tara:strand:- start:430 stop:1101 length:672 start_codon:yes stop_codon:yes gene_type:complete